MEYAERKRSLSTDYEEDKVVAAKLLCKENKKNGTKKRKKLQDDES